MGENGCLEVSSEIYTETKFRTTKSKNGSTITHFTFFYPLDLSNEIDNKNQVKKLVMDNDGDLILERRRQGVMQIEHKQSTNLSLVGLQVWRGALLLSDFLFDNRWKFENKRILELGSGVGLTSIAASIFSKNDIVCTDIDIGGILDVVKSNIELNKNIVRNGAKICVMELDFKKIIWPEALQKAVMESDIIIAADVIYDNDITDCFIKTLQRILDENDLNRNKDKNVYIALEKRYVFTLAELDTMAPCYEYFLQCINDVRKTTNWKLELLDIDFPQYFDYERSKELVIIKLYL